MDEIIALLAGHISTLTAKQHYYQKPSDSWKPQQQKVPEIIASFDEKHYDIDRPDNNYLAIEEGRADETIGPTPEQRAITWQRVAEGFRKLREPFEEELASAEIEPAAQMEDSENEDEIEVAIEENSTPITPRF